MSFSSITKFIVTASAVLAFMGCGSDDDDDPMLDCNSTEAMTASMAGAAVIMASCAGCHSAPNPPGGVTLPEDVMSSAARIRARAVDAKTMPPAAPLNDQDVSDLSAYLDCL